MAFVNKVGNMLKQTVSKHTNLELSAANPSLYQAIRCMSSSKLFIGGLAYSTDEMSLREAFAQYGEVVEAKVIMDRDTGRSRGFGFVTYTSSDEASSAIQALDGKDLHGRMVRVNYATERSRGGFGTGYGGDRGYGGSGSYGGGGYYGGGGNNYTGGQGNYYGGGGYGGGNYGSGGSYGGGNSGGYGGGGSSENYSVAGGAGGGDNYFGGGSGGDSGFASSGDSGTTGTLSGGDGGQLGGNQGRTDGGNEGLGQDMMEGNYKDDDDEPHDYANTRG